MYHIVFKRSAQKELSDIPKPYNHHIVTAIDKLAENPRPDGVKKLKGNENATVFASEITV
ncbi:MAG TPA: hypothetical protein VF476_03580 [Chitinophagaceae bacterium]